MDIKKNLNVGSLSFLGTALCLSLPAQADAPSDHWQIDAGLGVNAQPYYPGSDKTRTSALPFAMATYGRYFIGPIPDAGAVAGAGVSLIQDEHWRVGVALGGELVPARRSSDSPRLNGLSDVDSTAFASTFVRYTDGWFSVHAATLSDIGGQHQGTRVILGAEGRYHVSNSLALTLGPSATWANSRYDQTFFGIDAAQHLTSGLPLYTAKAGVNTVAMNVGADYNLSKNWILGTRFSAGRLRGDAENSPITASKTQDSGVVFVMYHF